MAQDSRPVPGPNALWIELAPSNGQAPKRLIVLLHGAGHNAETMMPIGIAWQLKFPSALVAMLDAPERAKCWYDPKLAREDQLDVISPALAHLNTSIETLWRQTGLNGDATMLAGFAQGADLAIEAMRQRPELCNMLIAYAGRLLRPVKGSEDLDHAVHLIHGELDSQVPLHYAHQVKRHLESAGCTVSLDIAEGLAHDIDQDAINLSTWRAMKTIFKGREQSKKQGNKQSDKLPPGSTLH